MKKKTPDSCRILFVTGTDTGVGKTLVSKMLIEYFVSQGERVAPMKPVASGAEIQDGILKNDDAVILINAANTNLDYATINPYVFEDPIAPHIAAAKNNVQISLDHLNQAQKKISASTDRVIVEGAGGWQVPLTQDLSLADWVSQNQWPVILVVGLRLGCINHARLTYLDIIAKQNPIAGWVVNTIDADVMVPKEIVTDLTQYIDAPLLGVVPWLERETDAAQYLDFSLLAGV